MWRELIERLSTDHAFHPPASPEQLSSTAAALGIEVPRDLAELLLESNGIDGEYGLGLIWPAERIATDNRRFREHREFRELYMPFEPLLFCADAGNGDQFAFVILDGVVRRPDVFVWNHEDDSRTWVAPSLATYLEWWLTGRLKL